MLYFTECLKANIDFENTQKSDDFESYLNEQKVKLSCAIGYVGFLKLQCKDGKWNLIAGRECKSKQTLVNSKYTVYEITMMHPVARVCVLHEIMKTVWIL